MNNPHVHPLMAGVLASMAPRPTPLHTDLVVWWPADGSRPVPEGRLLLSTRRDGQREGYRDSWGVWRLMDHTVVQQQDVLAYADMPAGPIVRATVAEAA